MKKANVRVLVSLTALLFFLGACGNEDKTKNASNTISKTNTQQANKTKIADLKNQNDVNTWKTPFKVSVLESSYLWANTLEGKILEADHVFVAIVEDMVTTYSDSVYDEQGQLLGSIPTTTFRLKLYNNLRGELPIGADVQASRVHFGFGDGKNEGEFITLIENDVIPEKGKTYVFLARVVEGELVILNGGEAPSNFPLENAPIDLDKQSESMVREVITTSSKIAEIEKQIENESAVFAEIGESLLNNQAIQARMEGHGDQLDLVKVVVN